MTDHQISHLEFADDLLDGAAEIAEFTGLPVRKVTYLAATGVLPTFKLGRGLFARKSELRRVLSGMKPSGQENNRMGEQLAGDGN